MAKSSSSSSGIGFTGALTITFIVLKLCKVITWSWIWVLSPLWITTVTCIIILAVFNISYVLLRKQYNQSIKKENNIQANKPKKS